MAKDELIMKTTFDLYLWLKGENRDSFKGMLFSLMSKADASNFKRLGESFPAEATIFGAWQRSTDPVKFFADAGIEIDEATAKGLG